MYFIYILYSPSSDIYYLGYTEDVDKRLFMHNNPIKSCYTSKHKPWVLKISFSVGDNKTLALKLERKIKKMKSRKYLESLIDPAKGEEIFSNLQKQVTTDC